MKKSPIISIVIPCFNEELNINSTYTAVLKILNQLIINNTISSESFIQFIDDGSTDNTWKFIQSCCTSNKARGLKLSRNFGHQSAVLAGLQTSADLCDAAISIDADLQQNPDAIQEFIRQYLDGYDIVLGVRLNRNSDSLFKKFSADLYYRLLDLLGIEVTRNHADCRLMSKRVINALSLFNEPNLFLRALIHKIGFSKTTVNIRVEDRKLGKSKYTLSKMVSLGLDGITSFSIRPLRIISALGFLVFIGSMLMSCYILIATLFLDKAIPGWASTVLPIYLIGGIQLLCLGVVGEYIGQSYMAGKRRPRWICEDTC